MIKCFFIVPTGEHDCSVTGYCANGHRADMAMGRLSQRPGFPDKPSAAGLKPTIHFT